MDNPRVGDLLDDRSEVVVRISGKVIVMLPETTPTDTGLVGILRY